MNRQTAEKVRFFMNGLAGRLPEIDEIEATFRSGLKNYTLTAPVDNGESLAFNFGGNSYALDYAGFVDFICGKVPDYDELLIVYRDPKKTARSPPPNGTSHSVPPSALQNAAPRR